MPTKPLWRRAGKTWHRAKTSPFPPRAPRVGRGSPPGVPFALARGGAVVRGIIDLLVVKADKATVIERLDGPPSAEHRNQMEIRLEAVEASAPGPVVTGYFLVEGRQLSLFQS